MREAAAHALPQVDARGARRRGRGALRGAADRPARGAGDAASLAGVPQPATGRRWRGGAGGLSRRPAPARRRRAGAAERRARGVVRPASTRTPRDSSRAVRARPAGSGTHAWVQSGRGGIDISLIERGLGRIVRASVPHALRRTQRTVRRSGCAAIAVQRCSDGRRRAAARRRSRKQHVTRIALRGARSWRERSRAEQSPARTATATIARPGVVDDRDVAVGECEHDDQVHDEARL